MDAGSDTNPSDAELIAAAKDGEASAFGVLYERYMELIFRYVRGRVSNVRDAEDITERVFLNAFESLDGYRERGRPYSAFLYQVARNAIIDSYRDSSNEHDLEIPERIRDPSADEPDDMLVQAERVEAIKAAMAQLSEDYQEVIRLRVLLSLPTSQAARWLKRSEGAVRVLLYRALKALREKMEGVDV
jgi:RNA polymerase sigma-70 factor (ECF subfamily)